MEQAEGTVRHTVQEKIEGADVLRRVAIIGLGVIGGSLAMALTQGQLVDEVIGVDRDEETRKLALATRAAHRVEAYAAEAVAEADLVVLATPVRTYPAIIESIVHRLKPGTIVTDVGSTKQWVLEQMGRLLPPGVRFVGGHPMAGSEKQGIRGADRYLLENAVYVLTPDADTDAGALQAVENLFKAAGARVLQIGAEEHDRMVALVSHLPHMMAVALVETLSEAAKEYPKAPMLAAGGFRDTTRVAAGDPQMWVDIACTNREPLLHMIGCFRNALDRLEAQIDACGGCGSSQERSRASDNDTSVEALRETLAHAREVRLSIPRKAKGILPGIHEIVVTVPDEPGVIGTMARLLGDNGVNIADIEILRVREGHGGTIRIGFYEAPDADRAVEVLAGAGIIVKRW
ncbi:prephenate dehydrogenase/arogenate dehydrogenase family protein [Heliobacterium undosum]|uniref:Prephenate dehydrogenase n=1 Tax=Heliomicrobium undosum TaxID=121734 RepID=A0A845KXV9_9FIRM|nr:prephenate dehydrogenase [Heliomicrobium undosum]MZP28143.1 prephenate dehydrogenase/arogenate dehydrogenase family protein [Heliomicrobium undosum]